jgi:hypothetical protein
MEIENSYEGAVRRLARLSTAGVDLVPSRRDDEEASLRQRMRDLEELATLATEENERLERELGRARETIARLQDQLTAADRQALRELMEPPPPAKRRSRLPLLLPALGVVAMMALQPWQYAPQAMQMARRLAERHTAPWAMPVPPPAPVVVAPVVAAPVVAAPVVARVVARPVVPEKHAVKHPKRHRYGVRHAKAAKAVRDADPLLGL